MHCENGMVGLINPPSIMAVGIFAVAAKNASSDITSLLLAPWSAVLTQLWGLL
jgi:hypothetical protein